MPALSREPTFLESVAGTCNYPTPQGFCNKYDFEYGPFLLFCCGNTLSVHVHGDARGTLLEEIFLNEGKGKRARI